MDVFTAEFGAETLEMLKAVAVKLNELGYVTDGYAEALIARERDHPTALSVKDLINVAIPHTDATHVLRPAIVVITHPESCFHFWRMDEPEKSVCVTMVFLMVVTESATYMRFLSDLMGLLQDPDFIETMKAGEVLPVAGILARELTEHHLKVRGRLEPHAAAVTP